MLLILKSKDKNGPDINIMIYYNELIQDAIDRYNGAYPDKVFELYNKYNQKISTNIRARKNYELYY